ncbi:MAG: GyrI-like domain-containing protein [Anaerolineales bacterium]|nr:GyrI-like domain-containing protein [Anaerolineales bacterium]MCK5633956.1 GyrI-like domain-containing protein [Anaerolineales bacterium]
MTKIDFKKEWKHLYSPPKKKFTILDVPKMQFLMVDGHGDPNTAPEYQDAIEALYGVAYKMKFISKKTLERDYVVPPLEGLWWAEDMAAFSNARDKSQWDWTMMIMTPEWITPEMFANALEQVREAKNPMALDKVRLERYHEGLSVQIMHVGSFDDEGPVLAEMHGEFIPGNGYLENGKHHEIYLSDFRKVSPEKLKTVLRQPVREVK